MTDNTESFYAGGVSGRTGTLQNVFAPVLNEMDAAGFDFTPYDSLKVGELDHLVILTSGYAAESGEPQSGCNMNPAADRIWSLGSAFYSDNWIGRQNIKAQSWALTSVYDSELCSNIPAKMGQIVHEITHGWEVPDLYDQDSDGDEYILPGGIGYFDIMSSPWGWYVTIFNDVVIECYAFDDSIISCTVFKVTFCVQVCFIDFYFLISACVYFVLFECHHSALPKYLNPTETVYNSIM
jgi:M6 family metalloprotease-like protein